MSEIELSNVVRAYLEVDQEIKQKQILADQFKDVIKREMESRGIEELPVDEHIVRYKDVLTSVFNKTAFKKKYEELYTSFLTQIQSKKFTIC